MLIVAVSMVSAPAMRALGQDEAGAGEPLAADLLDSENTNDADRARLLGLLDYRKVSLDFARTPARDAFATLRRLARIPLIVRWRDDSVGMGIDPESPITLNAADQTVRETLEAMLEQCGAAGLDECTWQLRRGFIEAGTKKRLSVPAAREMRLYEIRDLMIEAPRFSSDDNWRIRLFRDQIDPQHEGQPARPDDPEGLRKTPQSLAVGIVEQVCETIEPGRWDYGQPIDRDDREDDERVEPRPVGDGSKAPTTSPDSPSAGPGSGIVATGNPAQAQPDAPTRRRNQDLQLWATIRTWRDQLIVVAPDFIHRQIGGYPKAVPPDDVTVVPADEAQP